MARLQAKVPEARRRVSSGAVKSYDSGQQCWRSTSGKRNEAGPENTSIVFGLLVLAVATEDILCDAPLVKASEEEKRNRHLRRPSDAM